jgi:hypothetical protein
MAPRPLWIKKPPGNFAAGAFLLFETCGARSAGRIVKDRTDRGRTKPNNPPVRPTAAALMDMDKKERRSLEREVEAHMKRIEKIQETLHDSEENLRQVVDAPEELVREVSTLRMELRGRKAALAVGLSLLGIYQD